MAIAADWPCEVVGLAARQREVVEDVGGARRALRGLDVVADRLPEVALREVDVAAIQDGPVVARVRVRGLVVRGARPLEVAGPLGEDAQQKPDVGVLREDRGGLPQTVLRARVLASLREVHRRDHQRRALLDVELRQEGRQRRHEREPDQADREHAALPGARVRVEQRAPVEDQPHGAEADEERQGEDQKGERKSGAAAELPEGALADVVDGSRQVRQRQHQDGREERRRPGRGGEQPEQGQHRDARLVGREQRGRRRGHRLQRVHHAPVAGPEREHRQGRVGIGVVELDRRVVRALGALGRALLLRAPAQDRRRCARSRTAGARRRGARP